jgi:CxxC motif-containing protein (DUF1111 family)
MIECALARIRWRVGLGLALLLGSWILWTQSPGMPVRRAPEASLAVREAGLTLFEHEWKPGDPLAGGDGLGPVFNDRSCVACHSQGGVGGGGDARHNVASFEAHPGPGRPEVNGGVIHRFAVSKECRESRSGLHEFFPVVPGGLKLVGVCFSETRDFDPVRVQNVNPMALFGAGWIDRISPKSIQFQARQRSMRAIGKELTGDLDHVKPGRIRILADGRIGKFGWKAQFATLEEFVAAACANELGLGNPVMEQANPWTHSAHPTKVKADLDKTQFASLVAFVDTLPRPTEPVPADPKERAEVQRGTAEFQSIGCAVCHTPELGGVSGIYSDLLLHRLINPLEQGTGYTEITNVPLPDDHPLPDEWKTPPLWGVADSAPYFHDGGSPNLTAAIARHKGDAASVTRAFEALSGVDRAAIIRFLGSLKAPADARPAEPRSPGIIAMAH